MTDPRLRFLSGVDDADATEVLQLLDGPTIRLTGACTDWRHQVLLYGMVDLLGRIFPRLDITVDPTTKAADALPPGGATVGDRLRAVRRRSPLAPAEPSEPTITVQIGGRDASADLYVDASEWQSYVGRDPSRLTPPRRNTAIGPLAAACRVSARVYSVLLASVLDSPPVSPDLYTSALTYSSSGTPIDDPDAGAKGLLDALLIGAGSIGGAAAYAIGYEPDVAGHLAVCDPQRLDKTNPFRSVLATAAAAAIGANKVDEITSALAHHGSLTVDAHTMTITDWEAEQPHPLPLPLVLVAVDTRESRELIQDALPLEAVNAAVGADLVVVSGHRTGSGPCMCCLHMPEVLNTTAIKNRLIANRSGLAQTLVNELRVRRVPLEPQHVRHIERHRRLAPGALDRYIGGTLDALYNAEILYGETEATTASGTSLAVAAPFVTAQAGILLAGEALKRTTARARRYALGPDGPAIQYRENPYSPEHGYPDQQIARSAICLCRSMRRLREVSHLYGLDLTTLTG